jgi:hypothetical protein
VAAPIFIGLRRTAPSPCLTRVLQVLVCVVHHLGIPESELTKLLLRGSSVLTQEFRGPQMGAIRLAQTETNSRCIAKVTMLGLRAVYQPVGDSRQVLNRPGFTHGYLPTVCAVCRTRQRLPSNPWAEAPASQGICRQRASRAGAGGSGSSAESETKREQF